MKIKILDITYHRNGVGGEGFYAVLFNERTEGKMVATIFQPDNPANPRCAVYSIDKLSKGIISSYGDNNPLGENAYRGDDYYLDLLPLIKEFLIKQHVNGIWFYNEFFELTKEIETIQP